MYDVSFRPKPLSGDGGVLYLASGIGQARDDVVVGPLYGLLLIEFL